MTNQAGRNLITIDAKTGQFVLPNDTIANSISGYLERINMEFKEPINKIPARWHIDLIISSAIGGEEPGEYNVSMSSHLQNAALPSMLNGIAGALDDPRWSEDRFIRMRVYMKTRPGKDPVLAAAAYMSKADKDFLPAKWPWDDARRAYAAPGTCRTGCGRSMEYYSYRLFCRRFADEPMFGAPVIAGEVFECDFVVNGCGHSCPVKMLSHHA